MRLINVLSQKFATSDDDDDHLGELKKSYVCMKKKLKYI